MTKKNILGYKPGTMESAKRTSWYYVYAGLALMMILSVAGKSVNFSSPDWWITVGVEIFGFLLLGALLAQFISWIIRSIVEAAGKETNKFDYFAMTYLLLAIIGLIPKLFS